MTRVLLDRDFVVTIARDITESKRAQERLREYERVVEGLEEKIVVVDRDYRYVIANRAFLNYRGLEKEQVLGHRVPEIVDPDYFEKVIKGKMDECFEGKIVQYELSYKYPKLGLRRLLATYFPIEGRTGVDRIAMILQDITERRQREEQLREYQRVVQGLEEMIAVVDREYRFLIANPAFLKHRGMEAEQLIGRVVFDLMKEEGASAAQIVLVRQKVEECLQGRTVRYEMSYTYPNLGKRDLLMSYFPIEGPAGIDRIACILQDTTERTQAEEGLRRSEENYRMFVSKSSEGIFREEFETPVSIDLPEEEMIRHILYDAYIAEGNDALAAMYGLTSGIQLLGRRWNEMVPPDDPQNIDLTRQFVRGGFRVLDHESREVDIHGNPKVFLNSMIGTVENGKLVRTWGIQRDITEKVKAEEARRQAEEDLRRSLQQLCEVTAELGLAKE
jgi:PAS domain S-box-containing protein